MAERFLRVVYPDGTVFLEEHIGDGWGIARTEIVENPAKVDPDTGDELLPGRGSDLVVYLGADVEDPPEVVEGKGGAGELTGGEDVEALEAHNLDELKARAAELEIDGRSKMDKAELVEAIAAAEAANPEA